MRHSAPLWAAMHQASGTAGHGATTAQSVSASSLLVQMVVGLLVIIVLIKVASRLVQGKVGGRSIGAGRRSGTVAVMGRQSLGKGVQVAMVVADGRTYLLGVTQHQVTLLGQLDAHSAVPETADLPLGDLQLVPGGDGSVSLDDSQSPAWRSAIEQMRAKTVRRA